MPGLYHFGVENKSLTRARGVGAGGAPGIAAASPPFPFPCPQPQERSCQLFLLLFLLRALDVGDSNLLPLLQPSEQVGVVYGEACSGRQWWITG